MNDDLDTFEAELAQLQPRRTSPELAQRIAAELGGEMARRIGASQRRWLAATAALAMAASAAAAIWLWPRVSDVVEVEPDAPGQPLVSVAFDAALPSVWSFRHAESSSTAELDTLLDQHAGRADAARTEFVQTRGFGVSETEFHDLFGEL